MTRNGDRATLLWPLRVLPDAHVLLHLTFDAAGRLVDFTINAEKAPATTQREANELVVWMRDRVRAGDRLPLLLDADREAHLEFRAELALNLLCLEQLHGHAAREMLGAGARAAA